MPALRIFISQQIDMPYENHPEPDVARHLAQEFDVPEDTVIEVYEREFERLSASARITQFLDLITVKHVKDTLRSRAHEARPR
jgi:hypothetical protein